jgi:hypothetical protein
VKAISKALEKAYSVLTVMAILPASLYHAPFAQEQGGDRRGRPRVIRRRLTWIKIAPGSAGKVTVI